MKSILAFFFICSPVLAQDFVCKMTAEASRVDNGDGSFTISIKQWSGVAVNEYIILSVAHSITKGEAKAEFPNQTIQAEVVKFDEQRDLALFRTKEKIKAAAPKVAQRHPVLAKVVGFALGNRKVVQYPVSQVKAWVIPKEPLLVMDGTAHHGMSGGAVLDENGDLVGIQSSGDFTNNRVMASSLDQVRAFLNGEIK